MIGELQPWHLLIVAIVFVVLFGSRKLPDASRSLGRSLRIFKSEMNEMKSEFKGDNDASAATIAPAAITPATPVTATTPADVPAAEQPKA